MDSTFLKPSPDPNPELLLTIRFSASIPDVQLEIASPSTITAAGLKQLIRGRLPSELHDHRLRLIYAGRGLEDATPLSTSLKLPPSSRSSTPRTNIPDSNHSNYGDKIIKAKDNGKGKAPIRDPPLPIPLPHLYVHCSIGDIVLSKSDLAAETAIASIFSQENQSIAAAQQQQVHGQLDESMTTPAPRGFDRLLSAGFTPSDVSALRSQFLAIQSVSHTPDTMPSGTELRELEDRWMDEGSGVMGAAGGGGGGGITGGGGGFSGDDDGGFGSGSQGALDDMLWGAVMGFFWPIGCAMWLRREEGVWSWRKGLAVFVGVVVNVAFGAVRVMN